MKIRPMTESDQSAVSRVLCDCYRLLGRLEGLQPEAVEFLLSKRGSLESIQREAACQTFMVAEIEQRIVGMVAANGDVVAKLYVDPSHHGQGIGTALFNAAEAIIRQCGYDHLTLGSAPSAVGFYEAMGASVTGRKRLARGPLAGHRVVLMRKHLAQI